MALAIETLVVGQLQTNCYLVTDLITKDCVIIDPGDDAEFVQRRIQDIHATPKLIVATHGHFDHVLAVVDLQLAYAIPFLIHHKDRFLLKRMSETAEHFLKIPIKIPIPVPDKTISKDQQVVAGSLTFEIIQTPGHTPGSISLYFKNEKTLFSGDTWFADGAVGRTDFSYASAKDLHLSLVRLSALPDSTRLFSGHGRASSVGDEKMNIKESI